MFTDEVGRLSAKLLGPTGEGEETMKLTVAVQGIISLNAPLARNVSAKDVWAVRGDLLGRAAAFNYQKNTGVKGYREQASMVICGSKCTARVNGWS